jgi:stage III sporulation protein AD
MEVVTIAMVAVVVALLGVILRQQRPEQAMMLVLIAGITVLMLVLTRASEVFQTLRDMLSKSGLSGGYIQILFKGLGICLITQLASDTCKDAGESAMASKAELAGRISLLMVGLPLFQKITSVALSLIGG